VSIVTTCIDERTQCFDYKLKTYNIPDQKEVAVHKFDRGGETFCQITVSPNNQYVVFRPYCSFIGLPIPFQELFVWDLKADRVSQLTHYTNTEPSTWKEYPPDRYAGYELTWQDGNTLLVSVLATTTIFSVGVDPKSVQIRTELYTLPAPVSHLVEANFIVGWVRNPSSNLLAYAWGQLAVEGNTLIKTKAEVRIGTVTNGRLQTKFSGPMGCDLRWSPDGSVLAYTARNLLDQRVAFCSDLRLSPEKLIFIEGGDGKIRFSAPDVATNLPASQAVGWLRVPVDTLPVPAFPNGTPTPVPTRGPAG
jgi:hypothetical protein